jgi:putative thiamine transport system substrate-binding protein
MRIARIRSLIAAGLLAVLAAAAAGSAAAQPATWQDTVDRARGQTVWWHAWGGDEKINAYIAWAAGRVRELYGVDLRHVRLAATSEAVSTVLAEKTAGRTGGGRVDLIWLNGENFAAMKANGLLFGPWVDRLPNFRLVDTEGKPTTLVDFGVPTDGLESPWGMAQLTFYADTAEVADPPRSIADLLAWAEANPGRFAYPQPPDFTGTAFLKQALVELAPDRAALQRPADDAAFAAATAPLWGFLDRLHRVAWRDGRAFPQSYAELRQLVDDGVAPIGFAFNPNEASASIAQGLLPDTVRSYDWPGGTIGNTHFVAIPFNASAKEGAMVVADFLLSPEAQARKQDADAWGDPTVLAVGRLPAADRARFDDLPRGVATMAPGEQSGPLPEPHPSWTTRLADAWTARYAR